MTEEAQKQTEPQISKPRKWWLGVSIAGKPSFIEIVKVNDEDVPEDAESPPEFGRDDELTIDRGVFLGQVAGPHGMPGMGFLDLRQTFGPVLMPSDFDMSQDSSRVPLKIKGHSVLIGPYLWVVHGSPDTQALWDQVEHIYKPITDEDRAAAEQAQNRPMIAGPDGRAINQPPQPGAMGALGRL